MNLGTLSFTQIVPSDTRVYGAVSACAYEYQIAGDTYVAEIDAQLADTASFCEKYDIDLGISTNCLVIEAKRGDQTWYAACLVLASDMADVNGIIRRQLGARKASFAPKDVALQLTGMEYGGITPIGLPKDWPIFVDESVMKQDVVVIGGGVRGSKIAVTASALAQLPNAQILDIKRA